MVDDGRRTTEHGYTISSPCEPDGSGELTKTSIRNEVNFILKWFTDACLKIDTVYNNNVNSLWLNRFVLCLSGPYSPKLPYILLDVTCV